MRTKNYPIGSDYYFEFSFLFKKKKNIFKFWKSYLKNFKLFFSGRDALRFLLKNLKEKYFYLLPSYTCYEVIRPFEEFSLDFDFYRVYFNPSPQIDFDDIKKKAARYKNPIVIIIEYFGFPVDYELEIPFILDISHSLLTFKKRNFKIKPSFIFGSLRKILPLPDGGVLFFDGEIKDSVKNFDYKTFLIKLSAYLIRNFHNFLPDLTKPLFSFAYDVLDRNYEKKLTDNKDSKKLSFLTNYILKRIPYEFIIEKRRQNFIYLLKNLNFEKIQPLYTDLPEGICPLNFPFFSNNKHKIKDFLIKNRIYPPTLWPDIHPLIKKENYPEIHKIPEKILSLPIDHRYNINDMKKIKEVIERCLS